MPSIQAGNDVSQSTPGELLGSPLEPLHSQLEQFEAGLELIFDDRLEFIDSVFDDLLSRSPNDRFTRSPEIVREHVRAEFGSTDALKAQLLGIDRDRLLVFLERLVEKLRDETLESVFYERDADDHLVVISALQCILSGIWSMQDSAEQIDDEGVLAVITALWARLYDLVRGNRESLDEETVRDIARARYYLAEATNDTVPENPEKRTHDALYQDAVELGAIVAYANLNISVSRGAELAGVSRRTFESLLMEHDVRPRYGPQSVDELYENDDR